MGNNRHTSKWKHVQKSPNSESGGSESNDQVLIVWEKKTKGKAAAAKGTRKTTGKEKADRKKEGTKTHKERTCASKCMWDADDGSDDKRVTADNECKPEGRDTGNEGGREDIKNTIEVCVIIRMYRIAHWESDILC